MSSTQSIRLQFIVFALVAASFTNIYLTQPVLPILQEEFSVDIVRASLSVSAVILGIALFNLPFGLLVDRIAIQPIILIGGLMVAAGGLVCAFTENLNVLIASRFIQGAFIPALTTCIAAYLAKTLPAERLNIVMGSYVSATVLGGLGGRLLGGFIHPPLHWRYAFISAAVLILITTLIALKGLPKSPKTANRKHSTISYWQLTKQWRFLRLFLCAMGSFAVFSSVFNYLPFRLVASPFNFSTETITLLYLVYVMGIFMGPISGRVSNRLGSSTALIGGGVIFGAGLAMISLPFIAAIVFGLLLVCIGFFTAHAAAIGALNRKLSSGQGRANALYVLFYYVGGSLGITASGIAYDSGGWERVMMLCGALALIPLIVGYFEYRSEHSDRQVSD